MIYDPINARTVRGIKGISTYGNTDNKGATGPFSFSEKTKIWWSGDISLFLDSVII